MTNSADTDKLTSEYKFTYSYLMTNSADSDELVSSEANWSWSTLFLQKQCISGFRWLGLTLKCAADELLNGFIIFQRK